MTTPSEAADPDHAGTGGDQSQTSGSPLPSSQARGEDLRDDQRDADDREVPASFRDAVGQGTEPTTEQLPGEQPDESQGPA